MSSRRLGYIRLYKHLDKILMLFFTSFLVLEFAWSPLNSWLAGWLLANTGFQYLSYTNVLPILTGSPLPFLGMVLLFVSNILVAYFQIGYLFSGLYNLFGDEPLGLRAFMTKSLKDSWRIFKQLNLSKLVFVSFYIIVLFPILRRVLNIYYLNKLVIPTFIMEYLQKNVWIALVIALLALVVLVLSIRWMFALPQIFFDGKTVKEAIRFSWQKTQKNWWRYFWRFAWIVIKTGLFYVVTVVVILGLQILADQGNTPVTMVAGVINLSLIKLSYYMMASYFLLKYVSLLTKRVPHVAPAKQHPFLRIGIVFVAMLTFATQGIFELLVTFDQRPLVISHRGVSNKNGVQNTIASLEKTAALKPDFVEIDIQETADHQFVLMHDPNLRALAGIDRTPQEMTLEELTEVTVSENGYETKIPSFDAYLDRADALGQKLLVEIKTSQRDSADMMSIFLSRYAKRLKAKGHEIHSLDYHVVDAVVDYDKKLPVYFILPYNTIFPKTKATGYTMEYTTLDVAFTDRLSQTGKKVYDWTINDEASIAKSFQLDVDGMITDDVTLVQDAVKERFDNPDLYTILMNQAIDYLNLFGL